MADEIASGNSANKTPPIKRKLTPICTEETLKE